MNILRHFSGRIFACLMLVAFAAGAFLAFGRVSLPVTTVNGRPCFYYTPRSSSETVYGLSKRLGLTREEIVAYNPGAADGLRKNTTLYFPVDDFRDRIEVEAEGSDAVVPEQTDNNRLRPVHIEYTIDSTSVVNEAEAQGELPVAPEPSGADSATVRGEVSPYSIAVLLPFGLGEEQISRPARLATDFYKGFLIAADTLAHRGETVAVTAVDIASGSLDEALGREEVRSAAVIVAPDSPGFISRALKAGVKGYIVNTLDFADSLYLTEPRVVQTNIDHRNMYAKAVGYLISELEKLIKKYDAVDNCYFAAVPTELEWMQKITPDIKRCAIQHPDFPNVWDDAVKYDCSRVQFWYGMFDQNHIQLLHSKNISCNVFFADTFENYKMYFDMGMDTILTNRMDLAAKYKEIR